MVGRLLALAAEMAESRRQLSALAAERRQLLVELHDDLGWSDGRIAQALGVTRVAVQKARAGRPISDATTR